MSVQSTHFAPVAEKMQRAGLPDIAIKNFAHYYELVRKGESSMISEASIAPVQSLPDADAFLDDADLIAAGEAAVAKTVVLKLNGGLGTSMGLRRAKSLLTVKEDHTLLDIIAHQAMERDTRLVFMNSYNTEEDTLKVLEGYPTLKSDIPQSFLQHKVPKIAQSDLSVATCESNKDLEWCPPGHGDIYIALTTSGMLDTLLEAGYETLFVSNSDNLGAVLEPSILGHFVAKALPFMMEVADRTESDRKGGHLAISEDGQLILRESAQCATEDKPAFEDISLHRYFNTNNLWLNLPALKKLLDEKGGVLGLPMICNSKTVDPRDGDSTAVYQLETAMGSAIGVFSGSAAVRVPRSRFAPIKSTNDLLAVRSDAYVLSDDYQIALDPAREQPPFIQLDEDHYRLIDELEARFPAGAPSLINCKSLKIEGDITFGSDVVIEGAAHLTSQPDEPLTIASGAHIVGSNITGGTL